MEDGQKKETAENLQEETKTESAAPEEQADGKKDKKAEKKLKEEKAAAEAENKKLTEALSEEKDKYLRLAAEYDNFRRRSQKEKEGIYADAVTDAIKEILPLIDNLKRAAVYDDAGKVAEGLALMAKTTDSILKKLGVEAFGQKGDSFDPALHNAVMHEENGDYGENEIIEVFEQGYRRADRVIRFPLVKVAN